MSSTTKIVNIIRAAHPNTQAIYLYGTWDTEYQRPDSDLDLAVLLPHDETQKIDSWQWHLLATELAAKAQVEHADLINLHCVNTTLQAEILSTGRLLHCADENARLQFETRPQCMGETVEVAVAERLRQTGHRYFESATGMRANAGHGEPHDTGEKTGMAKR